jgi:hypothetical protein
MPTTRNYIEKLDLLRIHDVITLIASNFASDGHHRQRSEALRRIERHLLVTNTKSHDRKRVEYGRAGGRNAWKGMNAEQRSNEMKARAARRKMSS